jgi:hypothetical protein
MANFQIQLRNDTAANWSSSNPVLASGEMGVDITSGNYKIGDGATHWNSLNFSGGHDFISTVSGSLQSGINAKADTSYVSSVSGTLQSDVNTRATVTYVDNKVASISGTTTDLMKYFLV